MYIVLKLNVYVSKHIYIGEMRLVQTITVKNKASMDMMPGIKPPNQPHREMVMMEVSTIIQTPVIIEVNK